MENNYCFLAFGELALDAIYEKVDDKIKLIKENGGVSAFNTLYYLSTLGQETYAIGGVGTENKKTGIAIKSLKDYCTNTDYIKEIDKKVNEFFIYRPQSNNESIDISEEVDIGRTSPTTGKSSVEWSDKLRTSLPDEFKSRKCALIISNFEPVTRKFVRSFQENCNNGIVSLDITTEKIFEKYSCEEIIQYLKSLYFIQCNENTARSLCNKLGIQSLNELFADSSIKMFTVTKGSNGAKFYYDDNGSIKEFERKPKIVAPMVDTTGAGDAFHAMLLMTYSKSKNKKIDEKYLNRAFNLANALSRIVVQKEGARLEPYDVLFPLMDEIDDSKDKEEILGL